MAFDFGNRSSNNLWRSLTITQVTTATVSFLASSFIALMVARNSNGGLKSPYRRIIFGLSVSDILQSFALLIGPWSMPPGIPLTPWGAGNVHTCRFNGILLLFGACAVPMYVASLCIYYLCKLTKKMPDETFWYRLEWKIHTFIILTNVTLAATALGMDAFHPAANTGSLCFLAPMPTGCAYKPEIYGECINSTRIRILQGMYPLLSLLCLVVTLTSMGLILWQAFARERIFQPMSLAQASTGGSSNSNLSAKDKISARRMSKPEINEMKPESISDDGDDAFISEQNPHTNHQDLKGYIDGILSDRDYKTECGISYQQKLMEVEEKSYAVGPLSTGRLEESYCLETGNWLNISSKSESQDKRILTKIEEHESIPACELGLERLTKLYKRETVIQACCYATSFFVSYSSSWCLVVSSVTGHEIPGVKELWSLFYPIGGLFNILAFLRPQAASLRRRHPECSWLKAFWLVFKGGGEVKDEAEEESKQNPPHNDPSKPSLLYGIKKGQFSSTGDFLSNGAMHIRSTRFEGSPVKTAKDIDLKLHGVRANFGPSSYAFDLNDSESPQKLSQQQRMGLHAKSSDVSSFYSNPSEPSCALSRDLMPDGHDPSEMVFSE